MSFLLFQEKILISLILVRLFFIVFMVDRDFLLGQQVKTETRFFFVIRLFFSFLVFIFLTQKRSEELICNTRTGVIANNILAFIS